MIADAVGVPELGTELERAVHQVEQSLKREEADRQTKGQLEASREDSEHKGKQ